MRYQVRVPGETSSFEIERDEPLTMGDILQQFNMAYRVLAILPGEGDFDAIAEVEWITGPTQVSP